MLLFSLSLPAQAPVAPSAPAESKSSASKPDYSKEPAIHEFRHASMRYENDGSSVREVTGRIRVQTAAGLAFAGQLVFPYTAVDEAVEIRSVRVLKPDGSIITSGPEAVQDLTAQVSREAPMYTDAREKHVTVAGISVGDLVEYDVVWKAKPFIPGQFWQIWIFDNRMISLDEQLDLNLPADRALKIKASDGIAQSTRTEGDRRLYHWATSNLTVPPPIDFFKDFSFDVNRLLEGPRPGPAPRVIFSTFQSWAEVSDWYANLEKDRRLPTPEIRAKADEIVHGLNTDDAKAQALYYWVSQNIRYVSLSFGVGRYQPHPAGEVLVNRYGDCKDKTTLLEAMLDAAGIHAQAVLANARQAVDPDVPNPFQFDHAFTFLRLGQKDTWLDTTLGVGPYGYLAPQLRGQKILLINPDARNGLQDTPPTIPMPSEYHVSIDGTVDASGVLNATVELQTRGDLEVLIRILNDHVSAEQLDKTADSVLARTNRDFYDVTRFTDFKVLNASDTAHPVRAQFHLSGKPMYVNVTSGTPPQLAAAVTTIPIERWQLLSLLPGASPKDASNHNVRSLPSTLHGPRSYSFTVKLTFPSLGNDPFPPSAKYSITEPFASYESSDSWQGSTFHGYRSLTLTASEVSADESDRYAAFVQKVVAKASEGAEYFAKASPNKKAIPAAKSAANESSASVPPPPASALDLFNKGKAETDRKNWANAVEDFQSAVAAAPGYPDAWRELGRARMYLRQYSEAEANFRKYLELAPGDSRAYLNMAWVLYDEEKYQEDVDLMLKRIDDAPLDGDALARLGAAYLALHQPEKAVPVLERATDRFPKYAVAHFNLGRAYLATHKDDKAIISFRLALADDGSDSRLNSVAYQLAESKSNLDLAEAWSQQSIATVENELNDSTLITVGARTWPFVVRLGAYWDTLGWIKFQQGKTEEAEKYVFAGWQLSEDLTMALHLGQIYESQGHGDQAVQIYLAGLASVPPGRKVSEDAQKTRKRLADLLGGDSLVDERLQQYRKTPSTFRTASVPNPDGTQGIAQFTVIIGENSKLLDFAPTIPDDHLASLNDALRKLSVPQSFPDKSMQKLPRLATLACAAADQPCVFTLLPSGTVSRIASAD